MGLACDSIVRNNRSRSPNREVGHQTIGSREIIDALR
jgi:hypothetical protein